MNIALFEGLCVVVIVLTLGAMARAVDAMGGEGPARVEEGRAASLRTRGLLSDYALLALAGLLFAQTSILFYQDPTYAPEWHARVMDVPVLLPLIWPLVILSAREVRTALFPDVKGLQRAALLGAFVTIDASLIEVLATRAGLWSWSESGYLDVPLVGMVAWGLFAAALDGLLDALRGPARLLVIPGSVVLAHALICMVWWYGLRWVLREDFSMLGMIKIVIVSVIASALAFRLRKKRRLPAVVALPRLAAALIFVALLLSTAATSWPHWVHLIAIAVPSCLVTDWASLRMGLGAKRA